MSADCDGQIECGNEAMTAFVAEFERRHIGDMQPFSELFTPTG